VSWEKNFARQVLAAANETLYTLTPGKIAAITSIDIVNRGSTTLKVYLYLVPRGASASTANVLFSNLAIPAGASTTGNIFPWTGFEVLDDDGDTIQGYASSGDGTIHINGSERTKTVESAVS